MATCGERVCVYVDWTGLHAEFKCNLFNKFIQKDANSIGVFIIHGLKLECKLFLALIPHCISSLPPFTDVF